MMVTVAADEQRRTSGEAPVTSPSILALTPMRPPTLTQPVTSPLAEQFTTVLAPLTLPIRQPVLLRAKTLADEVQPSKWQFSASTTKPAAEPPCSMEPDLM